METPKGYTTITQIENYTLHTIEDHFKPQVEDWIAKMEKYIEKQTCRVFIADSVASEKIFDGNGKVNLFIDECVEVSKLTIGNTVISTNDYLFYPTNALPKTRIKLKDDSALYFTKDEQNIKVEAKWGYSIACPLDIGFATMILVVGIINFAGEMEGEEQSKSIGTFSITYKDQKSWQDFSRVAGILQQYKKILI